MKILIDTSDHKVLSAIEQYPELVCGQLITPLTGYQNYGGVFAIDNGAFSGFNAKKFASILDREKPNKDKCLFVTAPDVVGNARRTVEIYKYVDDFIPVGFPRALVAQDGLEDLDIQWDRMSAIFIGGSTKWKDSNVVIDICKTARILGKHIHIGRVNGFERFKRFNDYADTCDGSGLAMYSHMIESLKNDINNDNLQGDFLAPKEK